MTPHKRAVAVVGKYTDRSGQEKKRYQNVGTLFKYDDGGFALKLDCVPVGEGWNGFVSFYDIEERAGDDRASNTQRRSPQAAAPDLDDEIPF